MKFNKLKSALIAGFLVVTLSLTLSQFSFRNTVWAQDIDDVIQQLEPDFDLGSGKNEVKRSNLNAANEQNREDIKIKEQEETGGTEGEEGAEGAGGQTVALVDIILDIQEAAGSNAIAVSIVGGSTLATGVVGSMTQVTLQLPAGSTQFVKITCTGGGGSCDPWLFFIKGATFIGSSEGPNGLFETINVSTMGTFQILVNADNTGPTNVNPGPPV